MATTAGCAGDQFFHVVVELDDLDIGDPGALLHELAALGSRHIGPKHDERLLLQGGVLPRRHSSRREPDRTPSPPPPVVTRI